MKKLTLLLLIALAGFNLQASEIRLTFTAKHTCVFIPFDSVAVVNLTQGGSTVLYYPDSVLVFSTVNINEFDPHRNELYVSQNYPNPFSSKTDIDIYVPEKDIFTLTVFDLTGRKVAFFETSLDNGMHNFTFFAGSEQNYILTVNSKKHFEHKLMIQIGKGDNATPRIAYNGIMSYEIPVSKSSSEDFPFSVGDELRYTAYVTNLSGSTDSKMIEDSPNQDKNYVFNINDGIPNQPSVITGETTVCQYTPDLVYSVTNVADITYNWSMPTGWTIQSGQGTNSITAIAGESGDISVTAENTCGESTARTLHVNTLDAPEAIITSSTAPMCIGTTRVLTGTPSGGAWEVVSGPGSIEGITLTAIGDGVIRIKYTVPGDECDGIAIADIASGHYASTADAGPNQSYTDGTISVTLDGNTPEYGTGLWTVINGEGGSFDDPTKPDAIFTGEHCNNYTLRWTISTVCNSTFDDVNVTFNHTPTVADAGEDFSFTDNTTSINLAANTPEEGTGLWTVISGEGGSFDDSTKPDAIFTGEHCNNYILRWTISTECSSTSDDISITFNHTPTVADAGEDQIFNDGTTSVMLNANSPEEGTGQWSIVSGEGGGFDNINNPNSLFAGLINNVYQLKWSISTSCSVSEDIVEIWFWVEGAGAGVTDIDGNEYPTIIIGLQEWMAENLRTTTLNNGTNIPTGHSNTTWSNLTSRAYAVYPHSSIDGLNSQTEVLHAYGALYNWYAAANQNLCPTGWRVPTVDDRNQLINYLSAMGYPNTNSSGGTGNALKSCRQVGSPLGGDCATSIHPRWDAHATHVGFDAFGFSALPGGGRGNSGDFSSVGIVSTFWLQTQSSTSNAHSMRMSVSSGLVTQFAWDKRNGNSIRCIRILTKEEE